MHEQNVLAMTAMPTAPSEFALGEAVVVLWLSPSDEDVARQVYWPPCRFTHENPSAHGKVAQGSEL